LFIEEGGGGGELMVMLIVDVANLIIKNKNKK